MLSMTTPLRTTLVATSRMTLCHIVGHRGLYLSCYPLSFGERAPALTNKAAGGRQSLLMPFSIHSLLQLAHGPPSPLSIYFWHKILLILHSRNKCCNGGFPWVIRYQYNHNLHAPIRRYALSYQPSNVDSIRYIFSLMVAYFARDALSH